MAINQQQAQITEDKALQNQTEGELNDSDLETVAGGFGLSFDDFFSDFEGFNDRNLFSGMGSPSNYEQSSGRSCYKEIVNGEVIHDDCYTW